MKLWYVIQQDSQKKWAAEYFVLADSEEEATEKFTDGITIEEGDVLTVEELTATEQVVKILSDPNKQESEDLIQLYYG